MNATKVFVLIVFAWCGISFAQNSGGEDHKAQTKQFDLYQYRNNSNQESASHLTWDKEIQGRDLQHASPEPKGTRGKVSDIFGGCPEGQCPPDNANSKDR